MYQALGGQVFYVHPEQDLAELFLTVHPTVDSTKEPNEQAVFLAALLSNLKPGDLLAEVNELNQLFDLQRAADHRAVARWRAAHPEKKHIWPDRADMVVWLMEQHDALTTERDEIRGRVERMELEGRAGSQWRGAE